MASFLQITSLLFFLYASALALRGQRDQCYRIAPFCANLTTDYTLMRLPNFLGHDLVEDVTDGLRNWNPLVGATAGAHHCPARLLKIFLCSIYAPVCMKKNIAMKIEPCQSLCAKVRDSCNPVMLSKANVSWPSANNPAFNCSSYVDNAMCLKEANEADNVCRADLTMDELLEEVCASEFVLKIELLRHRNGTNILRAKAKVNRSTKKTKKRILRMFYPASSVDECDRLLQSSKSPSKQPSKPPQYLVMGKYEDGGKNGKKKMILTLALKWKKHYKKLLKAKPCSKN